jgi:hypothetical protein
MINLSKNAVHGQDAHSALISDLKQVLAKHDVSTNFFDEIADQVPVGSFDISKLNLADLATEINSAVKAEADLNQHNRNVECAFISYIQNTMDSINEILQHDLCLFPFEKVNNHITWYACGRGRGEIAFKYGHGRASITITFHCNEQNSRRSYDFSAKVNLCRRWLTNERGSTLQNVENFTLHSVAELFDRASDIFKYFIIERDVKNHYASQSLIAKLKYEE